jgi:glycosyltransferase involved in cell wall biosynthesis
MLIGIDASRAELTEKTGVERYSFEIIKALRSTLPPDVRVVLYSRVPLPPELGPWDDRWVNRVLRWPPRYLWTQLRLSYEMLVRRPDVLFVPSAALPRALPRRTVHTIHDATFMTHPWLYSLWERLILPLGLWDAKRARTIIVPSAYTASQIKHTATVVIPLGVSVTPTKVGVQANPQDSRVRGNDRGGGDDNKYFLVVGRVDRKKNLPVVLEAFEKFNSLHPARYSLKFVGRFGVGADEIVAHARRIMARAPNAGPDAIGFLGAISDAELASEMRGAIALLHPCPVEGFGLPVIEAMTVDTPVIVADHGGARESAGDAALVVSGVDAAAWAAAMEQIQLDMVRQPLIEKGRANAARFSWERAAKETWKALLK